MNPPRPPAAAAADAIAAWVGQAAWLQQQGRLDEALAALDQALAVDDGNADLHNRRGLLLQALARVDAARAAYEQAVALLPHHAGAFNNLGTLLTQQGRWAEAAEAFGRAVALRPDHALAWHNLGYVQREQKALDASVHSFEQALAAAPGKPFLRGDLLHGRMRLCDWRHFDTDVQALQADLAAGAPACTPFALLPALDRPDLQRLAAERMAALLYPARGELGPIAPRPDEGRLRVAYLSGDFREHPVASLTAQLIELHDRRRFEVLALSYGPATGDPVQRRLQAAFDDFIDVAGLPDVEVARLARARGVDVVVDLAGYTSGCRPHILALRPAPVRVAYLGYLGTMGAPWIDYLVVDRHLVPPAEREGYRERLAELPWYQVNDGQRPIGERTFTRAELGLPATGFVFCCLNNAYKITPTVFGAWMRILAAVPGSVLMLYAENRWMPDHLRREAAARGVDDSRLVFVERLPMADYLARYRVADLFLDTLPYNAGTTASDALWAGLPVLTCSGRSLAARVAGSLLHALGLPELVTDSLPAYEAQAVALATDPPRLLALRRRLQAGRAQAPLFDAARFTRHLEAAFEAMMARWRAGQPPADLVVDGSSGPLPASGGGAQ
jgi:predicted O-linked N-acetylglucosamine transferase (SPINDLY family)